ncbi:hypothetical protein INH39_10980 [Massilia violaceinigra]|uniref:Uncharacterized protein n=1 Tax=Massilia violaceinigra TaxID=2045208 RepID=A0ABY4ADV6_9BURK|nr:hypothetical protein [Massilia violaceinigra]UOD32139.1 hypothetical protein INH39_10980 [Massilia violaceinigra]
MTEPDPSVTLTLSSDEALVLFGFVQRFSDTDRLAIDDQAEQRALWNLCCLLEKSGFVFEGTYEQALLAARERLRDES